MIHPEYLRDKCVRCKHQNQGLRYLASQCLDYIASLPVDSDDSLVIAVMSPVEDSDQIEYCVELGSRIVTRRDRTCPGTRRDYNIGQGEFPFKAPIPDIKRFLNAMPRVLITIENELAERLEYEVPTIVHDIVTKSKNKE